MSVGFRILEMAGNVVKRCELLELSIVPVGSDPHALALARSAAMRAPKDAPIRRILADIDRLAQPDPIESAARDIAALVAEYERQRRAKGRR